jgi:hypothetical protein
MPRTREAARTGGRFGSGAGKFRLPGNVRPSSLTSRVGRPGNAETGRGRAWSRARVSRTNSCHIWMPLPCDVKELAGQARTAPPAIDPVGARVLDLGESVTDRHSAGPLVVGGHDRTQCCSDRQSDPALEVDRGERRVVPHRELVQRRIARAGWLGRLRGVGHSRQATSSRSSTVDPSGAITRSRTGPANFQSPAAWS